MGIAWNVPVGRMRDGFHGRTLRFYGFTVRKVAFGVLVWRKQADSGGRT